MSYNLTPTGIEKDGFSYPFTKPEGFDTWLMTKQEAFIQGYLHAYTGTVTTQPTPPTQEEPLL